MGMDQRELKQSRRTARVVEGVAEYPVSLPDQLENLEIALMRSFCGVRRNLRDFAKDAFAEAVSRNRVKLAEHLPI